MMSAIDVLRTFCPKVSLKATYTREELSTDPLKKWFGPHNFDHAFSRILI